MLYQTVDLFRAIGQIGLRPENIFALGKVYSNSVPVISAIRNMGATVVESSHPIPGEFDDAFERDVKLLWRIVVFDMLGAYGAGIPCGPRRVIKFELVWCFSVFHQTREMLVLLRTSMCFLVYGTS